MPELDDFVPYLRRIWDSKVLTNGGEMHHRLEAELADFLGVPHISLFNNGTIALMVALRALGRSGSVVTSPFSFVATTHSAVWADLDPIFADIDPDTLNLSPSAAEAAITSSTAAILPVHCYGVAADVKAFDEIATRHGIPVVYDAAHAFDVSVGGRSVLNHGEMSILSFHATKVFSTFEGGAIVSQSAEAKREIDRLKNFNILDETTVGGDGINGKMSEIHAAFGLLQLRDVRRQIARRLEIARRYDDQLKEVDGILRPVRASANGSYYAVQITDASAVDRDTLFSALRGQGIIARRYFYPLISNFERYASLDSSSRQNLPVANRVAERILCLPIYPDLPDTSVDRIASIVRDVVAGRPL